MHEASNYYDLFIQKQLKVKVKTYPGLIITLLDTTDAPLR